MNGRPAKPATEVRPGDLVNVTVGPRRRRLEVRRVIDRRVGAPIAAECCIEQTPSPDTKDPAAPFATSGGRPTKLERRRLDRLRRR